MKVEKINEAILLLNLIVNTSEYDVELAVNYSETIQLILSHKNKNIQIIVEDLNNHPDVFRVR